MEALGASSRLLARLSAAAVVAAETAARPLAPEELVVAGVAARQVSLALQARPTLAVVAAAVATMALARRAALAARARSSSPTTPRRPSSSRKLTSRLLSFRP